MKTTTSKTQASVSNLEDIFATFRIHSRIALAQFACLSAQWNFPALHFIPSVNGRECLDCTPDELAIELADFCEHYRIKRSPDTLVFGEYVVDRVRLGLFTVRAVYDNPYQVERDRLLGRRS